MNANEFMKHLESLGACNEAKDWALGKSWREVYDTCHRGDWLLWLYRRSKRYDLQKVTLAKGLCANTVRHLMKDERSVKAVDAAIAFGNGEISIDELNAFAAYANAAYSAAKKQNQQKTADIVREVLPFEIWEF